MLTQTYPVSIDGLVMEVMIGLPGKALAALVTAGKSIPAPLLTHALIDTGSDVTCVSSSIVQHLGLPKAGASQTQSISGSLPVNLYEASLSIPGASSASGPLLVLPNLLVMELAQKLIKVEVLVGLDLLLHCMLHLDRPNRQFSLSA